MICFFKKWEKVLISFRWKHKVTSDGGSATGWHLSQTPCITWEIPSASALWSDPVLPQHIVLPCTSTDNLAVSSVITLIRKGSSQAMRHQRDATEHHLLFHIRYAPVCWSAAKWFSCQCSPQASAQGDTISMDTSIPSTQQLQTQVPAFYLQTLLPCTKRYFIRGPGSEKKKYTYSQALYSTSKHNLHFIP